jgi:hypothetical protein
MGHQPDDADRIAVDPTNIGLQVVKTNTLEEDYGKIKAVVE